jgi:hypothetical protein
MNQIHNCYFHNVYVRTTTKGHPLVFPHTRIGSENNDWSLVYKDVSIFEFLHLK